MNQNDTDDGRLPLRQQPDSGSPAEIKVSTTSDPAESQRRPGRKLQLLGLGVTVLGVTSAWLIFLGWALMQLKHLV